MSHQMAVLGAGGLGRLLGTQIRRQPSANLVALSDISAASREAAGAVLDIPPEARYETLDDLLDGEPLDALVIATPHTLHCEQIHAALDRGIDVLCEKPLVTDLEDARDIHHRVESSDAVLMVGYQRHLEPEFRYARRRWEDGENEPTFISAEITEHWLEPNVGTWRVDRSLSGGGFVYDTGNHVIDAVLWATELTPATVVANMDFAEASIDVRANLTVTFEEGATAHLSFHADTPRVTERMQGWDATGGVRIEGREWRDRSITVVDEDGSEVDPYLESRDSAYERLRTKLDAFVDAIEGIEPPPATTRDALRTTAVTEAAYESARTGEPISVNRSQ